MHPEHPLLPCDGSKDLIGTAAPNADIAGVTERLEERHGLEVRTADGARSPPLAQFTREGGCAAVVPLPVKSKKPAQATATAKTNSVPATGTRFMTAPAMRAKATTRG